ncbi:fungal-specific transcription factor domain-containing protein [Thamnidium elegans]|nr:fungal-specific transcription factor domain-containing protein [Thamnidium elegans]
MQCKARHRPCSFYKDGTLETDPDHLNETKEQPDKNKRSEDIDLSDHNRATSASPVPAPITTLPNSEHLDNTILFAETSTVNHNKLKRRGPLMESRISNTLGTLGESMRKMSNKTSNRLAEKLLNSSETYGSFIMWMPEPSLPSRYSGSIEMPSREIQLALIDQYFNERHESIGMMIKYHFYEQLESKGLLITPLLLNVIYAHASRFVNIPGCPKTEVFYHRARRLVDDFMDVPRVSTVIALYLLSLYEPNPAIYRPGSYHCRQWQYSGMACRMSLELGLYDDTNIHSSLLPVEIELRRRVFWGTYDLDKLQSAGWERPWAITHDFIRTKPAFRLPDETEEDAKVLEVFNSRIDFVKIMEKDLILFNATRAFRYGNNGNDQFLCIRKENLIEDLNDSYISHQNFLQNLKPNLRWTPTSVNSIKDILDLPAPQPMVAHLHTYYNTITLALLEKLPSNSVTRFQSRVTAACMTQLAYHLCQTPSYVIKFDYIAHVLISAIKVHVRYLDDPDVNLVQQAWVLFDRSIWCVQLINSYAVIPNSLKFLQQVQNIYGLHVSDTNQSSSESPSPKLNQRTITQENLLPSLQQQTATMAINTESTTRSSNQDAINSVRFPDDINQMLTDWSSSPTSISATNDQRTNTIQLEPNSSNNIVYLNSHNSHMNTHYPSFNSTMPRNSSHQIYPQPSSNTFSDNTQSIMTSVPKYQQQHIWNSDNQFNANTENDNDILPYNARDIVVPSQLNEDDAIQDNNATMYQTTTNRFVGTGKSSVWPQQNTNSSDIETTEPVPDGDTNMRRGLGIYMSSRQHYEDMIKRPSTQ